MCGITILWGPAIGQTDLDKSLDALTPRGPDVTRREILVHGPSNTMIYIGFARLHIQGINKGAEQPFVLPGGGYVMVNGEIFNSEILIRQLGLKVAEGASDCAVVPALITRTEFSLAEIARQLDGDFAITHLDLDRGLVSVTRDPYGVRPLYWGEGPGWHGIVSELKGFPAGASIIHAIEPGAVLDYPIAAGAEPAKTTWHQVPWLKIPMWRSSLEGLTAGGQTIRQALEEAVAKRLTTVRTVGACLSGGLDSSLVAAIAARQLCKRGARLHTYSIGMEGSSDLAHARLVAEHIDSIHHERIVTAEDCLAAIPAVIRAIESFDITTVRASVGNYLLGRLIREVTPHVKVVLNGDGADEVLGGYLYMRAAPDDAAFEAETDRLLREIHMYDVARSERSMAAHGLESRSPFLDRQFIAVARALPTDALRPTATMIEKTILRAAFADDGLLPDKVLWRRKEAFSDGISRADRSWFEMAAEEGERQAAEAAAPDPSQVNPPKTGEARWYRSLWSAQFPEVAAAAVAPHMWMPRFIKGATDPSARTLRELYAATATI